VIIHYKVSVKQAAVFSWCFYSKTKYCYFFNQFKYGYGSSNGLDWWEYALWLG